MAKIVNYQRTVTSYKTGQAFFKIIRVAIVGNLVLNIFWKPLLLFLLVTCGIYTASAQKIPIFKDPQVDSNYIDLLTGKWSLRAFSTAPFQVFSIINRENGQSVKYRPNNILGVGLGFSYRFIILDLGINLKTRLNEATSRFDLQMGVMLQKHLFDLYFQTYSGFEMAQAPEDQDKFREDIHSSSFGINYFHIFNNNKLSLRSAFSGDQLQRRSTGTFLLGGYLSHYRLEADSSIIPSSSQSLFNEYAQINKTNFTGLGLNGGFAYSFVFPKNLFLFTSAAPGVGLNFGTIDAITSYSPPIGPEFNLSVKAAGGYAGPKVYIILSFVGDYFLMDLGHQNRYRYSPGKFKLVFGYRFKSKVKLLEKVNDTFKVD